MSNEYKSMDRRGFLKGAGVAIGAVAATGLVAGCASGGGDTAAGTPASPDVLAWGFGNLVEDIREKGKIVICSASKSPPQAYFDKNNELAGYDIEIAKMLANDLEVEIEFETPEFSAFLPGLIAGKYDLVLGGIANKPQRALAVDFTRGYVPYDQVVLVQAETPDIPWADLNDESRVIATELGSTSEYRTREAFPKAEIISLAMPEFMLEVAAGRADAAITEDYLAMPFAKTHPTSRILHDPATGQRQVVAREWGSLPVRFSDFAWARYLDNWLYWYQERGALAALYDELIRPALEGDNYWEG